MPALSMPKLPALKVPAGMKLPKIALPPFLKKIPGLNLGGGTQHKQVLVLEIGEIWLKMAVAKESKLAGFEASMIEGASDLDIAQKIMEYTKKENLKPTEILIAHPSHNLTMRILSLPSVDPREIKDIVDLQAVKQTPYSRDEITTGFHILGSDAAGYSRVLVAISHREVAARYFKITDLAGLTNSRMTVSLEGLRFWFQEMIAAGKVNKDEVTLVLDVDWMTTDLMLLLNDRIIFNRSIDRGAKHLTEQGQVMEAELVREIQRSLESGGAEMKPDEKVARIFLTGIPKPLKDFCAVLARELNMPCEVMDGITALPSRLPGEFTEIEKGYSVSFVAVGGIAIRPEQVVIDITPPEIQMRKNLEQRGKDLALAGTLLLAFVMVLSLICIEKIYKRTGYIGDLKKQYREIQTEAEEVERLVAKMKLAQEQAGTGGGVLDVLREISEVLPDNIVLSALDYSETERTVTIRGISAEMSGVFQFLTTLEGTQILEQVKTRNVSKRKVEDREVAEFEMIANIATSEQGKTALAATPPGSSAPEVEGAK
jgi:Tfp pilus assembly PilM family ATPase/Tfp pilus assembly protein PilN